jgi:hypothetical protein
MNYAVKYSKIYLHGPSIKYLPYLILKKLIILQNLIRILVTLSLQAKSPPGIHPIHTESTIAIFNFYFLLL